MKNQKWTLLWVVATVMLFSVQIAKAEDFNITIPVSFTNLPPEVGMFDIGCEVMSSRLSIGFGRTATIRISGGAYSGNLIARFNATAGLNPADATHYRCTANLRNLTGSPFYAPGIVSPTPGVIRLPTAAGTTARDRTGDLPIPR